MTAQISVVNANVVAINSSNGFVIANISHVVARYTADDLLEPATSGVYYYKAQLNLYKETALIATVSQLLQTATCSITYRNIKIRRCFALFK